MTTPKPPKSSKPLSKGGRVVIWTMIVLIVTLGVLGGIGVIANGVDRSDALADGPVGTLTPTDRECGDLNCWWVGEFVSADGAITRSGVILLDAEKVRIGDPMPSRIDNVHLHDDAKRPTAYTDDYSPVPGIVIGGVLLAFSLVTAVLLTRMVRRRTQRTAHTDQAAEA
jgi:hypothetical protein